MSNEKTRRVMPDPDEKRSFQNNPSKKPVPPIQKQTQIKPKK